ncbi:MAG TPA: aspartate aminotransferase family protein [Terriglobales bacterium]|nr:aspartate aminotransferase family protein [Terriglobales bacterium]
MADVAETYAERTPESARLYREAREHIAGGVSRSTIHLQPHPLYVARGTGARVWDADGTERLDFLGNYTALIHGHAHPAISGAIERQLARGTAFAAATEEEIALARELRERLPSVELLHFANSGTEATLFAMRLARAHTGRPAIARFEGHYHGSHDAAEVSVAPDPGVAGPDDAPLPVADSPGITEAVLADTVVLPFNDAAATAAILRRNRHRLAGVIVDPLMSSSGLVPARPEFLQELRRLTEELGMVLIFDEVISFRVGRSGLQGRYGVRPDLTTLGKIIGGGLPVAAFGGRRDLMELLDPERDRPVPHGGTYNAHALGMAAGMAAMRELTPDVFDRLERQGEWLRNQLAEVFADHRVAGQTTGLGSLFNVHFTDAELTDYRSVRRAASPALERRFLLGMLNEGVLMAGRGLGAVCTPMGDGELRAFVAAADRVLAALDTPTPAHR